MKQTRRALLKHGSMIAAAVVLPLDAWGKLVGQSTAASPAPTQNEYERLAALTVEDFKPFVGATFKIHAGSSTVRVTLAEVQNLLVPTGSASAPAPDPKVFALRFKNGSAQLLQQGTYVFENSGLGRFAMFVVPSATGKKPFYYTGDVNRSVNDAPEFKVR